MIQLRLKSPTYLLPGFKIILEGLAFTIKKYECSCYRKIVKYKNLTKHHRIKLIKTVSDPSTFVFTQEQVTIMKH